MCTASIQKNMPEWAKNMAGPALGAGGVSGDGRPRPIRDSADVPLGNDAGVKTESILQRRERIKQAQEHPGSHKPTGQRTRKQIMDELT